MSEWMTRRENIRAILESNFAGMKDELIDNAMNIIMELDQERKKGHWITEKERHFLDTRTNENVEMKKAMGEGYLTYINDRCSECRIITIHDASISYLFCPHCGIMMEE